MSTIATIPDIAAPRCSVSILYIQRHYPLSSLFVQNYSAVVIEQKQLNRNFIGPELFNCPPLPRPLLPAVTMFFVSLHSRYLHYSVWISRYLHYSLIQSEYLDIYTLDIQISTHYYVCVWVRVTVPHCHQTSRHHNTSSGGGGRMLLHFNTLMGMGRHFHVSTLAPPRSSHKSHQTRAGLTHKYQYRSQSSLQLAAAASQGAGFIEFFVLESNIFGPHVGWCGPAW